MNIANILKEYKEKSLIIFFISLSILGALPLLFFLLINNFSGFGYIIINSEFIIFFEKLCLINALLGIFIPTSILIVSFIAGLNRYVISKSFPILTFTTIYGLIFYIFLFVLNFSFIFFSFLNELMGLRLFFIIILIVSSLTFLKILPPIIIGILNFTKLKAIPTIAVILKKEHQNKIFSLVREIAKKLQARIPDNIIVGLTTDFFASNMDMKIFDGKKEIYIKGETLYISLPYLRVLTISELKSIVGHELAHFSGKDTIYTILFNPIKIRLNQQFSAFENFLKKNNRTIEKTIVSFVIYPIIFLFNEFSRKDERISKERELIADMSGSKAAEDSRIMINALCKIGLYELFWDDFEKKYYEEVSLGIKKIDNLSSKFMRLIKEDLDNKKLKIVLHKIFEIEINHPSDTHPSIERRMENLKVLKNEITNESLSNFKPSAANLINDIDIIETNLTLILSELINFKNEQKKLL